MILQKVFIFSDLITFRTFFSFLFGFLQKTLQKVFLYAIIDEKGFVMRTIQNIRTQTSIFNHLVYENCTDKHFAKHSHELYEFIYILRGEVDYIIEDRLYHAKENSLILIKPHTYHYFTIRSEVDYEKIGVLFHANTLQIDMSNIHPNLELLNLNDYPLLLEIFQKLDRYNTAFPEPTFWKLLHALIQEICWNLSLIEKPVATPRSRTPILSTILQYIQQNLCAVQTLDDISSALKISTSYLKNIFKKELKVSPKHYINEKRLLLAKQWILSGKNPTVIAKEVGFANYSSFYRAYLEYFRVSPSKDAQHNR